MNPQAGPSVSPPPPSPTPYQPPVSVPTQPTPSLVSPEPVHHSGGLFRWIFVLLVVAGLMEASYYLGSHQGLLQKVPFLSQKMMMVSPTPMILVVPSATPAPMGSSSATWKLYQSATEKAQFSYPADWIATTPAILSNIPGSDAIGLQSPDKLVTISWVSALTGFGGHCDATLVLGQDGACAQYTLIDKTPIASAAGLFVIAGTITTDGKMYQPFLAVQDKTGELLTSGKVMGYDMYLGKNNFTQGAPNDVLFSTSGPSAGGPQLTQTQAAAWFDQPSVMQAKQILLSLSYTSASTSAQ